MNDLYAACFRRASRWRLSSWRLAARRSRDVPLKGSWRRRSLRPRGSGSLSPAFSVIVSRNIADFMGVMQQPDFAAFAILRCPAARIAEILQSTVFAAVPTFDRAQARRARLYCFADEASAQAFLDHFPGLIFDPKCDRENGLVRGVWLRTGEYKRMPDLGPLSVPEILRN
ncbi:MAG: hypothetical protein E5X07_08095 [Mesorhizobium sp.]|nr:MAG: hypothetical protein E5X07_08095 [Mesorhizobium sp.]